LEPDPGGYPQPDCRPGAGSTRTQPAGTGGALHGPGKILCLRGFGLSASKSARSHHCPAYIVIKAAEEFKDKTTAPNQLWQTDFTYLKITGWGWYYLSTVLDDFSRFIVAWKLCATIKAQDVTATLDLALAASGLDQMNVVHRPRLLSDNGSSYVASDLADWLDNQNIEHVHGAPYHPQTQGKIERWHQTLKNRILLEHYYLPGDLERKVAAFVKRYNHARYHESLGNLTPADVYFGPAETILLERERIKRQTIANRRLQHHLHVP
jgi:putative transposase